MMKKQFAKMKMTVAVSAMLFMTACSGLTLQHNMLTDQEKKEGWALLFDGSTLNGWHVFNQGNIPSAWSVDSGWLVCNPHAKNVKHGDLVTDKVFENFDLVFSWRISKGGNSGLFVNVQERPDLVTTFSTGPEYQLLDDKNMDEEYLKNRSHKAASIFGVIPNNSNTQPNSGDWNKSRILQQNGKLTFWLNDVQTLQVDLKSEQWKKMVTASPMSLYPEFGTAINGHIAVQDWTNGVSFRDMKIKKL
jgi:hypothetical protein